MSDLAILGGRRTIDDSGRHYVWPRVTDELIRVVIRQLHTSISIYDKSGVIEEFEKAFAHYHHSRKYALTTNSGTPALYSIYVGLNLKPGDEVICPVYTFFATVSPLLQTGAIPVFCDCDESGNIDPSKIEPLITSRTRAVVVTHLWGYPCDMESISAICKKHNLRLIEDCSHAHGARIHGRPVGTFGDAAAWSLQAQKTITGGEGGIMLTDDEEIYYRALLLGQYNRRCFQEIPDTYHLSDFRMTGFGLKLRAHPLAIAIAHEQFQHLDDWIACRQSYADEMNSAFRQFSFLKIPQPKAGFQHSWYAYPIEYDETCSNGVDRQLFLKAIRAEGLVEVDIPQSTCPLHSLPIFTKTREILPHFYSKKNLQYCQSFPNADRVWSRTLKLPVWAYPDEKQIVSLYIEGICKVAKVVNDNPELLLRVKSDS
ncbi:MAG: DegT/DnrJ/EryC1/StrS family aminotransferase [Candidatus Methanomethylicaceae archaeon]